MLDGKKWTSTRGGWKEREEKKFRKCLANSAVIRLQGNWAFDTICGWGRLASISEKGNPYDIVTQEALVEAGCGHMTRGQYIHKYCTNPHTKRPYEQVITLRFGAVWTREGERVLRDMD